MRICPLCKNNDSISIKSIHSGNFDQSVLYDNIEINSCTKCGHVFNYLNENEIKNLTDYYLTEYVNAHNILYTTSPLYSDTDRIEITQKNLNVYLTAVTNFNTNNKIGLTKKYQTITLNQFIEHVTQPGELFSEISNYLDIDGILKISCPNSSLYLNQNVHFANYNFLIREHIQHFDSVHLVYLANMYGFALVDIVFNNIEILRNIFIPNMEITFRYQKNRIDNIINDSYFALPQAIKNSPISSNIASIDNCYCYGIGREFLFMQRNGIIKNIIGLIDNTPSKQAYTVDSIKICNDDIIKELPEDSAIFITALAHKDFIKEKLNKLSYRGIVL